MRCMFSLQSSASLTVRPSSCRMLLLLLQVNSRGTLSTTRPLVVTQLSAAPFVSQIARARNRIDPCHLQRVVVVHCRSCLEGGEPSIAGPNAIISDSGILFSNFAINSGSLHVVYTSVPSAVAPNFLLLDRSIGDVLAQFGNLLGHGVLRAYRVGTNVKQIRPGHCMVNAYTGSCWSRGTFIMCLARYSAKEHPKRSSL